MIYLELFLGFLKIGLFSFGGAYSAIPLIRDVVLAYGWLEEDTLTYMIAVSESTPGPIMINLATYIGSSQAGLPGALLATLAVVIPAFVITILVMVILKSFLQNKYVQAVLGGLKPCIIGIILATGVYMMVSNCISLGTAVFLDLRAIVITGILLICTFSYKALRKKKLSSISLIILAAGLGIVVYGI